MIGADMQFETIARPAARHHDRRSVVTENVETLMSRLELPGDLADRCQIREVDTHCRDVGVRSAAADIGDRYVHPRDVAATRGHGCASCGQCGRYFAAEATIGAGHQPG